MVIEFLPMLGCTHIDKVDYDDSAHVAQTQLPRNLVGGAEIDIKSVLLLILHVAVAVARVHIDHVKSFCVLNDDVCTRLERHRFSKRRLYLLRDVVEIENRLVFGIQLYRLLALRGNETHIVVNLRIGFRIVHEDVFKRRAEHVSDNANGTAVFLVKECRRL